MYNVYVNGIHITDATDYCMAITLGYFYTTGTQDVVKIYKNGELVETL